MSFNAGEAYLQIVPSFNGVVNAIEAEAQKWGLSAGRRFSDSFNDTVRRQTNNAPIGPSDQQSTKQGTSSAGKFADAFKARVTAALKSLPDITVDANTSDADAKIAELRQRLKELADAKIGVDIDEATALAAIDDIKAQLAQLGAESPSVQVKMDTAAATAQLDRLRAEIDRLSEESPDVDVKANTSEADAKLAATKAAADDLGRSSPSIGIDVDGGPALAVIGAIKTALLGLSAGAVITPLIGGLAAILGPLAAVGTGIAGIAAVGIPAFSAVTKAEQAQSAAATAGGKSASDAANQIKSAELSLADTERRIANDKITSAEQVKNAQQAVVDAETAGARSVAQADAQVTAAEQTLANAQKASLAAQQALTDAREQGARSLEDQAFAAQDAALNLQQDQLAVQEAQQNLDAVNANATSTTLQKQEAELQLQQAQQALAEQTVTLQRATEDNTKAQAAGVDGTSAVVSANNAITSAQNQQASAAAALTKAQQADAQAKVDATAKIASAEQSLADALRAQQQQAAQDASDLTRAHLAVAQAEKSSAGGASAYGKALAALTPAELTLKSALDSLKTKFKSFQTALDPVVIPLFTGGMKILGDLMKPLEPLITVVAKAIGAVETSVDKAIQGPGFKKFLDTLTSLAGPTIRSLASIFGNLAGVFANVVEAFAPLSGVVFGGLASLTGNLEKATKSPALTNFVKTLEDLAPTLLSTFRSIGGLIGTLFTTLAPLAQPVLGVIKTLTDALSGALVASGPALTQLFTALAVIADKLITALAPALPVIVQILADLATFVATLTPNELIGIASGIGAIAFVLGGPFSAAAAAAAGAAVLIIDNWSSIKPAIQPVLDVFSDIWGFITEKLVPVLKGIFNDALTGIKSAFVTVGKAVEGHKAQLQELLNAFKDIVGFIVRDVLPIIGPVIKASWELSGQAIRVFIDVLAGLVEYFNVMVGVAKNVGAFFAGPFVDFFVAAGRDIGGAWNATMSAIETAWNAVVGFFTTAWNDFTGFVTGVWASITGAISKAWDTVTSGVQATWTNTENFLKNAWTAFVGAVTAAWNAVTRPILAAWQAVTGAVQTTWTSTESFLKNAWTAFATGMSNVWHAITSPISTVWDSTFGALKTAYTDVRDFLVKDWAAFASTAGKLWDAIAGAVGKAFGAVTGLVKGVWHDVETAFVSAVNWVITNMIDKFIGLLNDVLSVFGIKIGTVSPVSTSVQSANAVGGVLPGYTPGTDGISMPVHMFSGGEGILVPEATRALGGKQGIDAINARYSNRIGQKFSTGGTTDGGGSLPRTAYEQTLLDAQAARDAASGGSGPGGYYPGQGGISGGIGGAIGDVTGVISAIRSGVASAAITALDAAEAPIKALLSNGPSKLADGIAQGAFSNINDAVGNFIRGNVTPTSPTTTVPSGSYEHQLFIETALFAGGHDTGPFNASDVNTIVEHESGWNPNAINLTDSNAAAGHPSQGLMQTIPSTFEAYRIGSLPDVITDPLANLAAGIQYAFSRYGSLDNVPGVKAVANGEPYVGYDNGGLLPPGVTSVFNGTGRPEAVLTSDQWNQLGVGGAGHLASIDLKLDRLEELVGVRQIGAAAVTALSEVNGLNSVLDEALS